MLTIAIPYQIQGKTLMMAPLKWPDRCACCGSPNPGSNSHLSIYARYTSEAIGTNTGRVAFYPLVWDVPYCRACLRHSRTSISPETPVFLALFLLWAGLGYWLFLLDLAYENIAIIAWVVALVVLAYGAYLLTGWFRKYQEKRTHRMMMPGCSFSGVAVGVRSDLSEVFFDIHNEGVNNEFTGLNGSTFPGDTPGTDRPPQEGD